MNERLNWLSLLRGMNILLVVMFHVQLIDLSTGLNHTLCEQISLPFRYFRMPLFIFVSGGLLYLSRINKEWSSPRLYIDKVKRIMLPFIFFVTFFYCFKLLMTPFVKTKVELSFSYFLESFVVYADHPSAHLWFLATLIELMLLYPLYRWLCRSHLRMFFFGCFSVFFYYTDFSSLFDNNYFNIAFFNRYLVFFFFGIAFFRYKFWRFITGSWLCFLLSLFSYVLCVFLQLSLLSSVAGIMMIISLSQLLDKYVPKLFSSFREYIFPIYLLSFVFQPFVELILWKRLFYCESLLLLFYLINVSAGIYGPVAVCKVVEHIPSRWVRYCFGLNR